MSSCLEAGLMVTYMNTLLQNDRVSNFCLYSYLLVQFLHLIKFVQQTNFRWFTIDIPHQKSGEYDNHLFPSIQHFFFPEHNSKSIWDISWKLTYIDWSNLSLFTELLPFVFFHLFFQIKAFDTKNFHCSYGVLLQS